MKIQKEEQISEGRKQQLGVENWAVWEKEASRFEWSYTDTETCLILEGEVTVESESGEKIQAKPGDLVQFPDGLDCIWVITEDLRKVFTFEEVELNTEQE